MINGTHQGGKNANDERVICIMSYQTDATKRDHIIFIYNV
jgi:hypothetical protein